MTRTDKGSVVARVTVGKKVRVKPGVNDPDFEDDDAWLADDG